MQRTADPDEPTDDRDRVHTASRDGPSSVSAAVLTVRLAHKRSARSADTFGNSVPTCLYNTCKAACKQKTKPKHHQ